MEAIHLGSVSDEVPSSPISYTQEESNFCIMSASQFQNDQTLINFPKNQLQTDIQNALTMPLMSSFVALQDYNSFDFNNLIQLSQAEPSHISLKKRLKQGPVTFKPFESFRALEETVRELNCYFQSESKEKHNNSSHENISNTEV